MYTVVDADDIGKGDSLKAHSGGYKAKVDGVAYKNVHFDAKWVAFVVGGDPEVPPVGILNADGSVKQDHVNPPVFVVNREHCKARNRFAQLKADDVVVNGYTSVMSVTDDVHKSYEYGAMFCVLRFVFVTLCVCMPAENKTMARFGKLLPDKLVAKTLILSASFHRVTATRCVCMTRSPACVQSACRKR